MSSQEPTINPHSGLKEQLIKAIFLVLFYFVGYAVWILSIGISIFQFFYNLFLNKPNQHLLDFSKNLNLYLYAIVRFTSLSTETKPYPFSAWPSSDQ